MAVSFPGGPAPAPGPDDPLALLSAFAAIAFVKWSEAEAASDEEPPR